LGLAAAGAALVVAPRLLRPGLAVPVVLSSLVARSVRTERLARDRAMLLEPSGAIGHGAA
jgi:hypothetical protein